MHTIIMGSGLAGITLARELRKQDTKRRLTLITANDGNFYAKPSLSNAFANGKTAASLIMSPPEKLARELNLEMQTHCRVSHIDAPGKRVLTPDGALTYDQLVLAVGAAQIPLALAGPCEEIISVNDLADYAALREKLDGKKRVAMIGAGLIGCEFANDLRLAGYELDLYDQASLPLERLLPANAAARMQDALQKIGIAFHLSTRLQAIERVGEGFVLHGSHGQSQTYAGVISAIGLRPRLDLAHSANLKTRLGIVTNAYLQTSDPAIYALGDCIELGGSYLPYVPPIMHCAKKLAMTLTGEATEVDLPAMPIVIKTPACPTVVAPPPEARGAWETAEDADGLRALCTDPHNGELLGFVLQGSYTRERMALSARLPKPALRFD